MSLLCDDLPAYSKSSGRTKPMITMFLKPNEERKFYRFRLINFRPENGKRDDAFIQRWVHTHWGKTDKGINIVDDTVTCLVTRYVEFYGNRKDSCPMCRHAEENFAIWKNSGWRDKIAMKKNFVMKRQFQGIVPVYVVEDPNNEKNVGKLKCFIFDKQEDFEKFEKLVHSYHDARKKLGYGVFNGQNAVDFYLRMEKVPEVRHPGEPNETTVEVRKITKMAFGKTPYDIPDIKDELFADFNFDEQYYVENTPEEIEAFYRKHYSVAMDNIPKENIDVLDEDPVPVQNTNKPEPSGKEILKNEIASDPVASDVDVDSDDLLDKIETEKTVKLEDSLCDLEGDDHEEDSGSNRDDIDSLMKDLDDLT